MSVRLFPPTTYGPGRIDAEPLDVGPRYVRTARMSRWHRPRAGRLYTSGRTVYDLWCTGSVTEGTFLASEFVPSGDRVCGLCDGRAVGAGQEQAGPPGRVLVFTPRHLAPPRYCPGSRSQHLTAVALSGTVGVCLACRETHPVRAMGGPYNPRTAIVQHPPGPHLVIPCPFHRWRYVSATADGTVACTCGRPLAAA